MTRHISGDKRQLILDQLTFDTNVDPEAIDVQIIDDNAVLDGTVKSYQERIAAEKTVQSVPGIRRITNNLRIKLPPDAVKIADDEIHKNLIEHLNKNEFIDTRDININVENSIIIFDGKVKSLNDKNVLTNIAFSTEGVVDVINQTHVLPAKEITDEEIASDIRVELEERALVDNEQIVVEVEDSVVHLRGNAPSWRVKEEIHEIASNTRSVTDVIDDIEIDELPIDNEYRE
jgi:osmotically-inducible protein OsmY